jgi:DNA-binding transcriptional LysR family regulator
MEIRVLRYFLAVAKDQTISGAAKHLNVTQPTLSRQLQDLERELDTKLLIRGSGSRSVSLTPEGVLLKQRAEEIIDLVDRAEEEVRSTDKGTSGVVSVGVSEYGSSTLVARAATAVRSEYPGVSYAVHVAEVADVFHQLDAGVTELAVLPSPVDVTRYNAVELAQKNRWGLLIPKGNPLASSEEPITPDRLRQESLVVTSPVHLDGVLGDWLGGSFSDLNIAFTCNVPTNVPEIVASGLGVALWFEGSSSVFGPGVVFRPLTPIAETAFHVVWRRNSMLSRAASAFLDYLRVDLAE